MPSFFDKLVSGVNQGVSTISENSKAIVEKGKLNSQVQEARRQRGALIQNLGETVYGLLSSGELHIEQCEELLANIKECEKNAADLQMQIEQVDRMKDETLERQKQEAEQRMAQADLQRQQQQQMRQQQYQPQPGIKCECGHVNDAGNAFCRMCGKKLGE